MQTANLFDAAHDLGPSTFEPAIVAPASQRDPNAPIWFVRCTDCLSVASVTERPCAYTWTCAACDGRIEIMGRVERDRLVTEHLACACNELCVSARGPICTCACGGRNHGTGLLVKVTRDAGKAPRVNMKNRAEAAYLANEYKTARGRVADALAELQRIARPDYTQRRRIDTLRHAIWKAAGARTHKGRLSTLRAALAS